VKISRNCHFLTPLLPTSAYVIYEWFLSWQAPELNTIHGEFLGYKISYRPRDVGEAKSVEIPIENSRATVRTIFKVSINFNFSPIEI
jgi:hypothetical protein